MNLEIEKDKILKIAYDHNKKHNNYYDDGDIFDSDLLKSSGLESHIFNLALGSLLKDGLLKLNELADDVTYIHITDGGKYFHEKGGYLKNKLDQESRERWKKTGDWMQKFAPIFISLFTAGWTVAVFLLQQQSDLTVKSQKASIDSLTRAIQKLTLQKNEECKKLIHQA